MLRLICDRCLKGEKFEIPSAPDRYVPFIKPSDKSKMDLCNDCREEFKEFKEQERKKQLEDSLELNAKFLNFNK